MILTCTPAKRRKRRGSLRQFVDSAGLLKFPDAKVFELSWRLRWSQVIGQQCFSPILALGSKESDWPRKGLQNLWMWTMRYGSFLPERKVVIGIAFHMPDDPSTKQLPPTLILMIFNGLMVLIWAFVQWMMAMFLLPGTCGTLRTIFNILDVRGCCNGNPCFARLMQFIVIALEYIVYMHITCILFIII